MFLNWLSSVSLTEKLMAIGEYKLFSVSVTCKIVFPCFDPNEAKCIKRVSSAGGFDPIPLCNYISCKKVVNIQTTLCLFYVNFYEVSNWILFQLFSNCLKSLSHSLRFGNPLQKTTFYSFSKWSKNFHILTNTKEKLRKIAFYSLSQNFLFVFLVYRKQIKNQNPYI